MSQEQVEIVRAHIDAYRRQDTATSRSFMDADAVVDVSRLGQATTRHGREAIEKFVASYRGAFEDYRYEVERLTDLGSGAVLAVVTETGRGKGIGFPTTRSFANLYTVIDGRIARITAFRTEHDALEAAGLSE
jgi:ketosteroid isomerase-like protein